MAAYPNQYGAYQNSGTQGYVAPVQRSSVAPVQAPVQSPPFSMGSIGLNEVAGIEGVNRYPLAPGATVPLKDSTSDLLFVKSCDMTGAPLPLRVFRMFDITEEYQQNEGPVTRKEFNSLQDSINELKNMLEFLTEPSIPKDGGRNV